MNAKISVMILCVAMVTLAGCRTVPEKPESREVLKAESDETIAIFRGKDPTIEGFFRSSYGYAVIPKIFKGAFWVGGAYGRGQVYEKGQMIGFCSMSQATLGFSFGGEFFREIIFFREKDDLGRFMNGEYTLSAQVTGVAATAGAATKADYRYGMAVFIDTDKGLMVDASLGGQKFTYAPGVIIVDTTK
jgi:lipid-binding SYLF domain-containing protein